MLVCIGIVYVACVVHPKITIYAYAVYFVDLTGFCE